MVDLAIDLRDVAKTFQRTGAGLAGDSDAGAARGDFRAFRAQRRGQEHAWSRS